MFSNQIWFLKQMMRRLWFTATLYCLFGIATALAAIWLAPYLPEDLPRTFGAKSVDSILTIIASSMLAVTTFSLTTLVSATSAAANSATPRATSLLLEDRTAQRALSTFLGSFLFSLIGLIALNTELYGERGRFLLFLSTLLMVALIVVTLLRWIDHLAGLGRVGETISRVEDAASGALSAHRRDPSLGARAWQAPPAGAIDILHDTVGYVQYLDMASIGRLAERLDATIHVTRRPGSQCDPSEPIAHLVLKDHGQTLSPESVASLRAAFSIGDRRSFDQDPRFGLITLSEIASKALSPGINDPGTAIDVLATITRLLAQAPHSEPAPVRHDRVYVAPLSDEELLDAAFMPISRDGAGQVEVAIRLQKSLAAIAAAGIDDRAACRRIARSALGRAKAALSFAEDRERLEAVHSRLFSQAD
ncbi:DUF2254 domain-containing protein [Allorhizobium pseudoryzae]|uniref:DUF2254 domain-containing protein n=1 Tax=Allorhizobium pseudoryzae TaxID=379684 RepID=UPI003CFDE941